MIDLMEALASIDPAGCSYEEWCEVGMALHAEGYAVSDWEEWSRRDPSRFHEGECARKWAGFGSSPSEVKGGTIVRMAQERGWHPEQRDAWETFGFDEPIIVDDIAWLEPAEVAEPDDWDPVQQVCDYLACLFDSEDVVGYVLKAFERDGRWIPANKGTYNRTCGQIVSSLQEYGNIEEALGTPNPEAGAWVRFNPLSGNGVRNADVADFRYALVESDEMDVEQQRAIIEKLELPCAVVVHSGGKSLHAIVHIDAADLDEYRRRVDYLYNVCARNGLAVDTQNKNPSRLSRLPGFMRGGRRQYIVSRACGKRTFEEWRDFIEEADDGLPDIEPLSMDDLPDPPEALIEGTLYPGDKMMLAGPSKAGKSFLLMELCVAVAEGLPWIGRQCQQGPVLYVNLELKREFCLRRFRDVYNALGIETGHASDIHVLNLRGLGAPLDRLSASIIRRAARNRYAMIVIDPIYKVMLGDENSAEEVGRFCNQLDKLAEALGCAVVYCHHHSKGIQGGKQSMDRASGSGVFARDADALLDMIELPLSEDVRGVIEEKAAYRAIEDFMDDMDPAWRFHVEYEGMASPVLSAACRAYLEDNLGKDAAGALDVAVRAARGGAWHGSAWRVSPTLREFPSQAPVDLWFSWPVHHVDGTGILGDIQPDDEVSIRKAQAARRKAARKTEEGKLADLEEAVRTVNFGEPPTKQEVADYLDWSVKTVEKWVRKHPGMSLVQEAPGKAARVVMGDAD